MRVAGRRSWPEPPGRPQPGRCRRRREAASKAPRRRSPPRSSRRSAARRRAADSRQAISATAAPCRLHDPPSGRFQMPRSREYGRCYRRPAADLGRESCLQATVKILYIVGFPRSGSTLLDRLIAANGGLLSAGEVRRVWERGLLGDELCGCGQPFSACPFWTRVIEIGLRRPRWGRRGFDGRGDRRPRRPPGALGRGRPPSGRGRERAQPRPDSAAPVCGDAGGLRRTGDRRFLEGLDLRPAVIDDPRVRSRDQSIWSATAAPWPSPGSGGAAGPRSSTARSTCR